MPCAPSDAKSAHDATSDVVIRFDVGYVQALMPIGNALARWTASWSQRWVHEHIHSQLRKQPQKQCMSRAECNPTEVYLTQGRVISVSW